MRCFVQTPQSPENRNPETQNIKKMKLSKSLQKTTKPAFQIETQGKKRFPACQEYSIYRFYISFEAQFE